MTSNDSSLSLEEVSRVYLEAEQHLVSLAARLESLGKEAESLQSAKESVEEAGSAVLETVVALNSIVTELQAAIAAIQRTDPAAVLTHVESLESSLRDTHARIESLGEESADHHRATATEVARTRTIALIGTAAAIVAAVLAGAGLLV